MKFDRVNHENKVLMLHHQKLKSWLPPGGHVEAGGLTHECAIREVKEETGLEVEFIYDSFEDVKIAPSGSSQRSIQLPTPLWVQLEDLGDHFHEDFIYLARAKNEHIQTEESHEVGWFSFENALSLNIFDNVRRHLTKLQVSLGAS